MFCAPGLIFGGTEGVGSHFMFCAPGLVFRDNEGVGTRLHVLRSRTYFRLYRGHRFPFSCYARSDSFSAVPRASGPFLMFCAPGIFFGGTEGVGSRFHVLRAQTHFRRYRGRHIPFSCFASPNTFSAVMRASGPFLMFCAHGFVSNGTEGVGPRFRVFLARIDFRWNRGRRILFSCFALPDSFSAVPRASGPVLILCVLELIFGNTEGDGARFHVLRARIRFRLYRRHRDPFTCFAFPNSFSAVPRASGSIFMFCAHGLFFGGTKGVGSRFHVFQPGLVFGGTKGVGSRFHVFQPGLVFGGTKGVGSLFNALRARARFRRYQGRRVPFSSFVRPDSFSKVPRVSGPVFMFRAPRLVFGGTEGVGSRFNVFRARSHFRWYRGRRTRLHVLHSRTHFRRYRGRQFPFLCFARPDSFSSVPLVSGPVFMLCAPGLVLDVNEGVASRFHVLRSRTRVRRYRGRRVPFLCLALSNLFSAVPRASGPFLMFCAPGLVFGSTEAVRSRFHVLRARTRFRI
jgi:hypothetical protein